MSWQVKEDNQSLAIVLATYHHIKAERFVASKAFTWASERRYGHGLRVRSWLQGECGGLLRGHQSVVFPTTLAACYGTYVPDDVSTTKHNGPLTLDLVGLRAKGHLLAVRRDDDTNIVKVFEQTGRLRARGGPRVHDGCGCGGLLVLILIRSNGAIAAIVAPGRTGDRHRRRRVGDARKVARLAGAAAAQDAREEERRDGAAGDQDDGDDQEQQMGLLPLPTAAADVVVLSPGAGCLAPAA